MRGLCETCSLPFAGRRRGLYVGGRTVSAATTVADPIGGLAALDQHVVEGDWVVGLVFCHSELTPYPPANALRALSPMPAFRLRRMRVEEVVHFPNFENHLSFRGGVGAYTGDRRLQRSDEDAHQRQITPSFPAPAPRLQLHKAGEVRAIPKTAPSLMGMSQIFLAAV